MCLILSTLIVVYAVSLSLQVFGVDSDQPDAVAADIVKNMGDLDFGGGSHLVCHRRNSRYRLRILYCVAKSYSKGRATSRIGLVT